MQCPEWLPMGRLQLGADQKLKDDNLCIKLQYTWYNCIIKSLELVTVNNIWEAKVNQHII